jgi:transcriptional regulator with XRE-family HTH domain
MTDSVGARIGALRREHGWSQGELANALAFASGRVTLTREEVSRWERGKRNPTPYWAGYLALVLRVPTDALRPAGPPALVPADDVHAAALAWLVEEPPQLTALRSGRRVGRGEAATARARVAQLRHLDDRLAGYDLAPLVLREHEALRTLVDEGSYTERVGRDLLGSLAESGQILGWTLADAGQHTAASARYLEGLDAARAAGEVAVGANLVSCLAYQYTGLGQVRDAVLLARAAVHGAGSRTTPLVRVLLLERLAYACAHAQDAAGAARVLADVDDLYNGRDAGADEPEWTYWVDRPELDVMAARCATRLGQPGRAAPLLRGALDSYQTAHTRETALYLSFLAEAYWRAGQLAEAAETLTEASTYAAATGSYRVDERITTLRRQLEPAR